MHRPVHVRSPLVVASLALSACLITILNAPAARGEGAGLAAKAASEETLARGEELFARQWLPNDPRSRGGDGLGPVYNERSCLGCHHQGGTGGSAGADRNIEIITATGQTANASGAFYSFSMSYGAAGFQYRIGNSTNPSRPPRLNLADLVQIHPGFRDATSVVLHRFGPDPDYRAWRESIPGQHGAIFIRTSQRNPTPLFGLGLIDAIPDEVIESAARRRFAGSNPVRGRVSRLADGRIGRFGWKAQTATLAEFVHSAAAVELGLEMPGRHQAGDPRIPVLSPPGLDLDEDDCDALVAYVRNLSAPDDAARVPDDPKEVLHAKAGASVFKSLGCAHCHMPSLGDLEGIYSDLLLHDMSPQLGDTSSYGVFAARAPGEAPPRPRPIGGRGPARPTRSGVHRRSGASAIPPPTCTTGGRSTSTRRSGATAGRPPPRRRSTRRLPRASDPSSRHSSCRSPPRRSPRSREATSDRPPGSFRQADVEVAELPGVDGAGGAGHEIGAARRLGEGDAVADVGQSRVEHHQAIQAEGDAAVGRGAVAEGSEEESEFLIGLRGGQAQEAEDPGLDVRVVATDRATGGLLAVDDEVISLARTRAGSDSSRCRSSARGIVNG